MRSSVPMEGGSRQTGCRRRAWNWRMPAVSTCLQDETPCTGDDSALQGRIPRPRAKRPGAARARWGRERSANQSHIKGLTHAAYRGQGAFPIERSHAGRTCSCAPSVRPACRDGGYVRSSTISGRPQQSLRAPDHPRSLNVVKPDDSGGFAGNLPFCREISLLKAIELLWSA